MILLSSAPLEADAKTETARRAGCSHTGQSPPPEFMG